MSDTDGRVMTIAPWPDLAQITAIEDEPDPEPEPDRPDLSDSSAGNGSDLSPGPQLANDPPLDRPARRVVISGAMIRGMSTVEVARAAQAVGVPPMELSAATRDPYMGPIVTVAFAWQIVRRREPELTWAEAQATFQVAGGEDAENPTMPRPSS